MNNVFCVGINKLSTQGIMWNKFFYFFDAKEDGWPEANFCRKARLFPIPPMGTSLLTI